MKNIASLWILTFLSLSIYAQDTFPESWIGNYKGNLNIYSVDSIQRNAKMNLTIQKTSKDSIFDWIIRYEINGKKDRRTYSLVVIDKEKGKYQIDEKNGIVIDSYLYNQRIVTSFFKVMGNFIVASYTKEKNTIIFEIISSKSEPVRITGNIKFKEEDIPEVKIYPVKGRQKAILVKY